MSKQVFKEVESLIQKTMKKNQKEIELLNKFYRIF